MNELTIFDNEQFGKIRAMMIDDEPWFFGKDVANALEYERPSKAVMDHVDGEDMKVLRYKDYCESISALWAGENDFSNKTMINESGIYSLIFSSNLKTAKQFKHWVTHDVIPSIRKTGSYIRDDDFFINMYFDDTDEVSKEVLRRNLAILRQRNSTIPENYCKTIKEISNELKIFAEDELNQLKEIESNNKNKYTGFFYVLEYGDWIKIGSTKSPYTRITTLKSNAEKYGNTTTGRIIISSPHTNYIDNEKKLHTFFSEYRKPGTELFNLSLDEALGEINNIVEYKDDTEQLEEKSRNFLHGMQRFILNI